MATEKMYKKKFYLEKQLLRTIGYQSGIFIHFGTKSSNAKPEESNFAGTVSEA